MPCLPGTTPDVAVTRDEDVSIGYAGKFQEIVVLRVTATLGDVAEQVSGMSFPATSLLTAMVTSSLSMPKSNAFEKPTIATRASRMVMMVFLFIVLLYLDTEHKEMWNVFYDVRREVRFDEAVAAKTASPIFRLVPIRTIQDERNEPSFLYRSS